jgi:hypothetical protein
MNKKLLGLLLALVIANPLFAGCKDFAKDCFKHALFFPCTIPIGGKAYEEADGLGDKIVKKCPIVGLPLIFSYAAISRLALIGGLTFGIVKAVKYYKSKKQLAMANESGEVAADAPEALESTPVENPLLQNQVQIVTDAQDFE